MTVRVIIFTAILVALTTSFSSQTEPLTAGTTEETHIAHTDLPDDGTTFLFMTSSDVNTTENGTEFSQPFWTTGENNTDEGSITQVPDNGTNITDSSSPCTGMICKNGGTCIFSAHENNYKCLCRSGYVGTKCEVLDNCAIDDDGIRCKNGACVYGKDRKHRYCKCFLGEYWDTMRLQCRPPEEPCFPNPCGLAGNCAPISAEEYQCTCQERFSGRDCEIEDACSVSDGGVLCENGDCVMNAAKKRKSCECFEGFYLDPFSMQCRKRNPPCEPNPCVNNGTCTGITTSKYNCSCLEGYVGERCEMLNRCKPDSNGDICKNGVCKQDGLHSKRCFCSKGYYFDESSDECKKISPPCLPNPCSNGGVCSIISSREFNCSCLEEFYGKQCNFINGCISEGNEFCKDVECLMSDDNDDYICQCPQGQHFDYGSRKCKVTDMCPLFTVKENAICENNRITCSENFKNNNVTDLCEPNFCETKGCPAEGMICEENTNDPGNYRCFCRKGYAFDGKSCNSAFCTVPGLNNCEQICVEGNSSFTCECHDPFVLKADNKTCEYSGNMTCSNTTCEIGHCIIRGGEERCLCPPGYEENIGQCKDKCSAGALPLGVCPDNQCEATPNGFRCKCQGKYKLSPDNVTCTAKQLCSKNEYGWEFCSRRNAACVEYWNEPQGFLCRCPSGTVKMENGSCTEMCAVEANKRKCSLLGATCSLDTNFDFTCTCPPSFQQAKQGASCDKLAAFSFLVSLPVPLTYYIKKKTVGQRIRLSLRDGSVNEHKLRNDVIASMTELYEAFENSNILKCIQEEDFLLCTVELQFRDTNLESLKRIKDSSYCVSKSKANGNLCLVPPALILRKDKMQSHISIEKTDPCSPLVKSSLCEQSTDCTSSLERKSFSCLCKSGFIAHKVTYPLRDTDSVIETCNDIDECTEENPCPQGTVCSNTIGSYKCFCRPGYRIITDSSDPTEAGCTRVCDHTPCVHGVCSITGDHSFQCICEPGFSGALCDSEDKNYKDAKTNTIIVGAVLGGILLIVVILFLSKISRTHRKFGHESGQLILGSTEMTERRQIRGGIFNDGFERE